MSFESLFLCWYIYKTYIYIFIHIWLIDYYIIIYVICFFVFKCCWGYKYLLSMAFLVDFGICWMSPRILADLRSSNTHSSQQHLLSSASHVVSCGDPRPQASKYCEEVQTTPRLTWTLFGVYLAQCKGNHFSFFNLSSFRIEMGENYHNI